MNPGDVVLINFPFDDVRRWKRRPVLVMASLTDSPDADLIVLQVTSSATRVNNPKHGDIVSNDPVFVTKPSVIRCRRIFSLRSSQVLKPLGTVDTSVLTQARQEITAILAL